MTEQLRERQRWEGKGDFLYKVELAADMAVKSLTLSHLTHLWWLHGFAFRIIDAVLFLDIRHLFCSICFGYRSTSIPLLLKEFPGSFGGFIEFIDVQKGLASNQNLPLCGRDKSEHIVHHEPWLHAELSTVSNHHRIPSM